MEENFLLARSTVLKRLRENNPYYPAFVCILYALLQKYGDEKDIVINAFLDCNFIFQNGTVNEIAKRNGICLNQVFQDNFGGVSILNRNINFFEKPYAKPTSPIIIISLSNCLLDEFILDTICHEMCHIIDGYSCREDIIQDEQSVAIRVRKKFYSNLYMLDYSTNKKTKQTEYTMIYETIHSLQLKSVIDEIINLKHLLGDQGTDSISMFLKSLDETALKKIISYRIPSLLMKQLYDLDSMKMLLENHPYDLIETIEKKVGNDFLPKLNDLLEKVHKSKGTVYLSLMREFDLLVERWKRAFSNSTQK